jgi:hypothetical protein
MATKEECKAVYEFMSIIGQDRITCRKPFSLLKLDTQRKKVSTARNAIRVIFDCMVGMEELETFQNRVCKSHESEQELSVHHEQLIRNIADYFLAAETRVERYTALGIISPITPYELCAQFIPGLTRYMWSRSRFYAARSKKLIDEKQLPEIHQRLSNEQINKFVEFITR